MSKLNALKYFMKSYATALPRVVKGMFNFSNPRAIQRFIYNVLDSDDFQKDCPRLGSASILEILKPSNIEDIEIRGKYYEG